MPENQNPYLALLQQEEKPPGWAQILQHIGNLGFGLAGGFGQAATTGQPTMAGIGPGLMMGNQLNAQAAQQAEQERMKRLEWQFRAQEHEDKRAELLRNQAAIDAYVKAPGFQVSPTQSPVMGPNTTAQPSAAQPGPDLKTGGAPLVDYLTTKHGFSPLAASTVVGNLYQESKLNPAENTGDSGSAFGLAQWRLDRQTGLRNFAAAQNKPVTDPQVQLDYLVSEMKGGDMGAQRAYAGLQQAKTPQEANAAMMHFFRPAGYTPANPTGGHGYGQRVANTQALLPNGQPAPQVAQGDAVAPPPRPGPTLSALPAFEGRGLEGTIQPGALPEGALPSWNMPAAAPPSAPPGSPVTQSGAPVDPNAPPPPFMRSGDPNAPPPPGQPPVTQPPAPAPADLAPPPEFKPPPMRDIPPEVNAQINRLVGLPRGVGLTIQQAEEKKHQLRLEQWKVDTATAQAQHNVKMEVYKQQQEGRRFDRGQEAQQWAVLDPKNAQMMLGPGYDPSKAYQINKKGEIKPVGGAQVQIDMGGKAVNEIGKQRFQQYEDKIRPAAQGAVTEIAAIHSFRQLLDAGAFTGAGAESKLWLARIAESLGVPSDKAGNTQVLMSAAAERVLASIKTLGANPTDSDRDYLAKARAGDLTFTEDGLRKIISIGERNARKIITGHNSEVKRLRVLEGIKDIPEEFFQLDDVPDYETWSKANPLPKPSAPPPPGTTPGGTGKTPLDREIERRGRMGGG